MPAAVSVTPAPAARDARLVNAHGITLVATTRRGAGTHAAAWWVAADSGED